METLFVGLALAAVTGFTWLAWHEPQVYRAIAMPVVGVLAFGMLFVATFNFGVLSSIRGREDLGNLPAQALADTILKSSFSVETFAGMGFSALYLFVLFSLPVIRQHATKSD